LAQLDTLVRLCEELHRSNGFVRIHIFAESRGEETFTLAIALHHAGLFDVCEISASDIDPSFVAIAQTGVIDRRNYSRIPAYARKYFTRDSSGSYRLDSRISSRISHDIVDVLAPTHQASGPYHLVLMQNLLVHLTPEQQRTALQNAASCQAAGGYLALGGVQTGHLQDHLISLGYSPILVNAREIYEGWEIQRNAWFRCDRPYWALPPFDPDLEIAKYATLFRYKGC